MSFKYISMFILKGLNYMVFFFNREYIISLMPFHMLYYFLQKYNLTKYVWKIFNFPSYFLQKIIIDIYILVIYKILTKKKDTK